MAASYDMGWQKKGKGHNSSYGHGASMGLATGKGMDCATRCKNVGFEKLQWKRGNKLQSKTAEKTTKALRNPSGKFCCM